MYNINTEQEDYFQKPYRANQAIIAIMAWSF